MAQNNQDFIGFVQFTHPGHEHQISKRNRKKYAKKIANGTYVFPWNYGGHKRKFIETNGMYVGSDGSLYEEQLQFWGEWEPTSFVSQITKTPNPGYPTWLHRPFIKYKNGIITSPEKVWDAKKKCYKWRQNSDPCVFGDNFHYCCCKQSFKSLRFLAPGSIILFGSTMNMNTPNASFALDTVFVVGDGRDYCSNKYDETLSGFISKEYADIVGFDLWKQDKHAVQFRCYKGVNYNERKAYDGMFSFVPCQIRKDGSLGFERVILKKSFFDDIAKSIQTKSGNSIFTDNLNAAPKITIIDNIEVNKRIWEKIRKAVEVDNGLRLGVKFNYKIIRVP